MKPLPVLYIGATVFLSACSTKQKEDYQQAYEQYLADGSATMTTLRALDAGDIRKTRRVAMTSLHVTLDALADFGRQAHPTLEQKREETKLAREVLDYMLMHDDDFDPRLPSVRIGVRALKKILTEADDVRRLQELLDSFSAIEKKMETQKP